MALRKTIKSLLRKRYVLFLILLIVALITTFTYSYYNTRYSRSDYVRDLILLGGHLKVGEELLELGTPIHAEPHFGHPVKELWDGVKQNLGSKKIQITISEVSVIKEVENICKDIEQGKTEWNRLKKRADLSFKVNFKHTLNCLDEFAKKNPGHSFLKNELLSSIYGKIDELALKNTSPKQIEEAVMSVAKIAKREYLAGIDNDTERVINAVEYEDAWGFLVYLDRLFKDELGVIGLNELDEEISLKYSLNPSQTVGNLEDVKERLKDIALDESEDSIPIGY